MKLSRIPLVLAILACPVLAQNAAKLKQELRTKERAAQKDPEALFETAKWAKEQSLEADAKRLFEKVLTLDPDHAGANEALGNVLVEGKWLPAAEAERLRTMALEAEYKAKGLVKVDEVWVEADQVEDARRGVFHHDGELVTAGEKAALLRGKVRHPETGELIDADNLEKAKGGYFPISDGRWVDLGQANEFHSDVARPWALRSGYATILSTLPLEKIKELKIYADQGQETVAPLFGGRVPVPSKRPVIIIAKTESEYRQYGTSLGDGTDVAGAFLMRQGTNVRIPYQGDVRAAICDNHKDWGPRYLRHAAAIAYCNAIAQEAGAALPLWFVHGVGSYTSRFENDSDAGWFGKQHMAKGGVGNLRAFFAGFALNGDLDSKEIAYNLYQAGLMLAFATRGGDAECLAAMQAVTEALSGKGTGSVGQAVGQLEKQLIQSQDEIVKYLQQLIAKAP